MSAIVDLRAKPMRAFVRGFWKGLASPVLLYSTFRVPPEVDQIAFRNLPKRSTELGSLKSDWKAVGKQIKDACESHA